MASKSFSSADPEVCIAELTWWKTTRAAQCRKGPDRSTSLSWAKTLPVVEATTRGPGGLHESMLHLELMLNQCCHSLLYQVLSYVLILSPCWIFLPVTGCVMHLTLELCGQRAWQGLSCLKSCANSSLIQTCLLRALNHYDRSRMTTSVDQARAL